MTCLLSSKRFGLPSCSSTINPPEELRRRGFYLKTRDSEKKKVCHGFQIIAFAKGSYLMNFDFVFVFFLLPPFPFQISLNPINHPNPLQPSGSFHPISSALVSALSWLLMRSRPKSRRWPFLWPYLPSSALECWVYSFS